MKTKMATRRRKNASQPLLAQCFVIVNGFRKIDDEWQKRKAEYDNTVELVMQDLWGLLSDKWRAFLLARIRDDITSVIGKEAD